ncbi:LPS export ABC transporter periplasmic protein LptC [Geomonas subterranea]|uniref:LPS export ABC transporter periplasmic protein LptC n=1 Tax=Geomonas subterranea TaxID=2847989 RepID=A0ABX8LG65_9BACT|nr:LPS export ABC transporter periplasmic protein LptC [Geomonas subterranea]QXE90703.1 LPS export ABC transporter periplasmic protein LptC [Geomonas subterranea]QXM11215.1 LPS export ABC transporter periplasmic protein LptC [Geomonas subterranea]
MHNFNNFKRFLGVLAVVASLLVVATILFRMQQEVAPKLSVRKLPLQVDVSLQKFHYTETKQGIKRWELTAERADYNKQADISYLSGVIMLVHGAGGVGDLQITAQRAEYHNGTRDVVLTGDVRGKSSKGYQFFAPRVDYVAARSLLKSSERVRMTDIGSELEGTGMEYYTQTRKFKLLKDVSAVYRQGGE